MLSSADDQMEPTRENDDDDEDEETTEEENDADYDLYSDIAAIEYDYDEELYEDVENEVEARAVPSDPLGKIDYIDIF